MADGNSPGPMRLDCRPYWWHLYYAIFWRQARELPFPIELDNTIPRDNTAQTQAALEHIAGVYPLLAKQEALYSALK